MAVSELFSSLEGSWRFIRTIPGQPLASGIAIFTRFSRDQLHYREEGEFKNGPRFYREYVYSYREEVISILFKENPLRLFQTLQFQNPSLATATHRCFDDTYKSKYRFIEPGHRFQILHKVTGPQKDYEIDTTFYKE